MADGCCVLHSVDAEKPAYMASQVRQEVHDDREDRLQRGPYALVLARWQRKWSSSAWRGRGAASRDGVVSCGGEEQRPRRGSAHAGKAAVQRRIEDAHARGRRGGQRRTAARAAESKVAACHTWPGRWTATVGADNGVPSGALRLGVRGEAVRSHTR